VRGRGAATAASVAIFGSCASGGIAPTLAHACAPDSSTGASGVGSVNSSIGGSSDDPLVLPSPACVARLPSRAEPVPWQHFSCCVIAGMWPKVRPHPLLQIKV
jgi:hypothetical protein